VFVTVGAFSLAPVRRQKLRSGSGIKRKSLRDVFVTVGAFSLAQVRRQKLRSGRVREPQGSRAARYCVGTIERGQAVIVAQN
jgi:hypothetical protein